MPFEYDLSALAFHPVDLSPWNVECLNVRGYNGMLVPIQGVPGSPESPSFSFQNNERTGWYDDNGYPALSIDGFKTFSYQENLIEFTNWAGKVFSLTSQHTVDRTQYFQDKDGTIALTSDLEYVILEAPTEVPNGIITTFTLSNPAKRILNVFINGLGNNPYTHTTGNSTLTVNDTITGDTIKVEYVKIY
jgi:hypothetical protein